MDIRYVWDPIYLQWKLGDGHPTDPRRAFRALELLGREQVWGHEDPDRSLTMLAVHGNSDNALRQLNYTHDKDYVTRVLEGNCGEWEGERPDLGNVARWMFAGTMAAVEDLRRIEALESTGVRAENSSVWFVPMGAKHHAQWQYSSGFCVFNDFAWAARELGKGGKNVVYLDWDAHHGDGVENLLARHTRVVTCSIHDKTIFPGTGHTSGNSNWNYALEAGAGDPELLDAVEDALIGFDAHFRGDGVDYLLLAAGADGHANDPLSTLEYTHAGFVRAARMVGDWARERGVRVIIGGAGGYRPEDDTPVAWALVASQLAKALAGGRAD